MSQGQGRGPDGNAGAAPGPTPCPEVLERLYAYLDGELTPAWERRVARHVELCVGCAARLRFEKRFLEAIRRTRDRPAFRRDPGGSGRLSP